jgi:hypothetical protein
MAAWSKCPQHLRALVHTPHECVSVCVCRVCCTPCGVSAFVTQCLLPPPAHARWLAAPSFHHSCSLSALDDDTAVLKQSCWWRLGQRLLTFPFNVGAIVAIVGVTMVFNLYALQFTSSDDMTLWMPRGSQALSDMKVPPPRLWHPPHPPPPASAHTRPLCAFPMAVACAPPGRHRVPHS